MEAARRSEAAEERRVIELLVVGGWVITVDDQRRIFRNGAVAVDGTIIVDVGTSADLTARYRPARTIAAAGQVVIPGLVNGQRHLLSTAKGAQPDGNVTLLNLRGFVHPSFAALSEPDMQVYTKHATAEMIRFGTTTFEEPGCVHPPAVLEALDGSGIRCRVGPWTWDHGGVVGGNCPDWLRMDTRAAGCRLRPGSPPTRAAKCWQPANPGGMDGLRRVARSGLNRHPRGTEQAGAPAVFEPPVELETESGH